MFKRFGFKRAKIVVNVETPSDTPTDSNSSSKGPNRRVNKTNDQSPNKSSQQNGRSESNSRKVSPVKSRSLDNKTYPRGSPRESVTRKDSDIGCFKLPGAKKQDWENIFHFAPREKKSATSISWKERQHRGRNESGGGATLRFKFSKENFLQANCQFLVNSNNDYNVYLADPDLLVDWDAIEQIVVTMIGQSASCPICLGKPIAAKMTRCGHIFCWSCILHYLSLSDDQYRPCPICYEDVYSDDLKSVVTQVHRDVELGDIIEMELLRRHKDMLSVSPMEPQNATAEWKALYSKLLIISDSDVRDNIISREQDELSACLEEDPDCPEVCFVHQAISELANRKSALNLETVVSSTKFPEVEIANAMGLMSITEDTNNSSETEVGRDGYYYFYQDCGGRNIFLHPMNFSMLVKEFGSDLFSWPQTLTFRIIDKEYYSSNEETRKRWKFLRHLPLSSPFIIIEVDLQDYVSVDVIAEFLSQIDFRQSRREKRLMEEKKMEKIIAERERKLWNIPVAPNFEPKSDFPEFLSAYHSDWELSPDFRSSVGHQVDEEFLKTSPTVNSFAQIASRAPIKKSPSLPVSVADTISLMPCNGTSLSRNPALGYRGHSDSEPESEDHVAVPEFKTSMTDAITKALENLALDETKDSGQPIENSQRKKKKNKGKILFATGGMGPFN